MRKHEDSEERHKGGEEINRTLELALLTTSRLLSPLCLDPPWRLSLEGRDANEWERQEERWVKREISVAKDVASTKQSAVSSCGAEGVGQVEGGG